jgi:dihydrolipoamide dehydrogenase
MKKFDVAVIGGGPAGYVAAIRSAQLNLKTICIDNYKNKDNKSSLGGTCLNVGCIPSKALLETSHKYHDLQHKSSDEGITFEKLNLDVKSMIARKNSIVTKLTSGISQLFKANKVEFAFGTAKVVGKNTIQITGKDGQTIEAKHIILASGSTPIDIPSMAMNHKNIVDSSGALDFESVPKKLGIVGAGVIGLELGSVWNRLGSEVTIFEAADSFLPMLDNSISKKTFSLFKKQGLKIELNSKIESAKSDGKKVNVVANTKGKVENHLFDKLVVAIGRKPLSANLLDESVGVKINQRGFVEVDEYCHTGVANIYAIGDLVRGPMLAHKGSEEGVMVAERIAGEHTKVNYDLVPNVIYTSPEIAWVGKNEQQLKEENIEYKIGDFPFAASGRAMANNNTEGSIRTLVDKKTNKILGVYMFGAHVSELLAQAVIAMEFGASAEDLGLTIFAHPSLSEAVKESALASMGHAIHAVNKK